MPAVVSSGEHRWASVPIHRAGMSYTRGSRSTPDLRNQPGHLLGKVWFEMDSFRSIEYQIHTLIIVLAIAAVELQCYTTVWSVPAFVAAAFPLTLAAHPTLAMACTAVGTALDGAVFAIPASYAQARSVLALTMLVAATIAQLRVAVIAAPFRIAGAGVALATTVLATVEVAQLLGAVVATPLGLACTGLGVQIKVTMTRAVGQALQCVLVHGGTVSALPAFFADAGAVSAEAVS